MTHYEGQCYCGAIGFDYATDVPPPDWSIRACQCRFCRAHDALSTSDPGGKLRFTASDPEQLQRFRFAMKTADFLLCRNCGVYIGAVIETGHGRFGIINTHALTTIPDDIADVAPISYDSEQKSGRVARREERWTPVTSVPS
ncbi:MAG: hypothetical protein R3288_07415 [Woeseiaceae bacterium]|nr:hypothetical protein [Woeseiaceae bacterium]